MLNQSVGEFFQVNACDVIILEGILVFHDSRVRDLMNMKIFVDTGHRLNSMITSCSIFDLMFFWRILDDILTIVCCDGSFPLTD